MDVYKKIAIVALSSMISGVALAEQVRVNVDATVTDVYDPGGVLVNVMPGSAIGGQYFYETTTADMDSMSGVGFYPHQMGMGGFDLSVGAYQLTTDVLSPMPLDVFVMDEAWAPGEEAYHVASWNPIYSGDLVVDGIMLDLYGQNGGALLHEGLTSSVPRVQDFNMNQRVDIHGSRNGQYFSISAQLNELSNANGEPPASSSATQYTFKVTAQVDYVNDAGGYLSNAVMQGSLVTAYYTVDTSTPGYSPYMPEEVVYQHGPGKGAMSIDLGGLSIESNAPEAYVWNGTDTQHDFTGVRSEMLTTSSPTVTVDMMDIHFGTSVGTTLTSSAMVTDATVLAGFEYKFLHMGGNGWGWSLNANIISVELVPTEFVEVVPGSGLIHPAQRFDAAVFVTDKAPIMALTGSVNGYPMGYDFNACQIFPEFDKRQSVVCPDMQYSLVPGDNQIMLQLHLMDMSTESVEVNWTLSP